MSLPRPRTEPPPPTMTPSPPLEPPHSRGQPGLLCGLVEVPYRGLEHWSRGHVTRGTLYPSQLTWRLIMVCGTLVLQKGIPPRLLISCTRGQSLVAVFLGVRLLIATY